MIEVKNVSFRYEEDSKYVLRDVSLDIKNGEFVSILGHNGSGKSTLAKLMNGLFIPTEGQILVDGMDTKDDDNIFDIRSRAGVVFQNPDNQIVATIVEEDVAFGPENLGIEMPELRERVDKALKSVGMYEYRKSAPHLLSGGQKQRVAIAGILAMHPNYIILDEPTAMLDPGGREEVMSALLELNKQGKTIVLITHFMEEAKLSDRIFLIEEGKLIKEGTPLEIFKEVEMMKKIGLDVPHATEVSHFLKNNGIKLEEVLNVDDLVNDVWQLLK